MKAHTLFTSLLCAVVMLPLHAAVTDGLTVYYNFDNNSDDSAGSLDGNADTVDDNLSFASGHSGSYGPGLFGGGAYLGSGPGTGHAEAPFSPDVDGGTNGGQVQAITVQWWGKVAQFQTGWQIGVGRGEGGNWRFHRWGDNQTMAWQGGGGDIHGGANVNDGQWHHFVGTSDLANNNRTLYIDGVVQASQTMSAINSDPNLPLMIGENPQALNRGWNGEIDDVAIWNRPLSADEVDEIYQGGVAGNSLEDLAGPPTDDDNDTLRDNWEQDLTGNLTDLNGTAWDGNGVTPGPGAGTGDFDGDGRSDLQEYDDRTDPTNADSDGDGSSDGEETTAGTDPLNTDSDGDGLLDGVETGTGIFVDTNDTGTDPLDIDSDGDNATDGFEVGEGTDPNDAASTPSVPIIQPSFVPINELAPGAYGPDFTQRGVNYQENHYGGGVIFNNNALSNYTVHTSGVPAPTASFDAIEPLTAHGNGGGTISIHNRPWLDAGGENFTARYNGYLDMTAFNPGTYKIHLGADDTNYFIMNTADGDVISQHNCCPANQEHTFTINIPGMFPFDNVFGEQGGGDWTEVGISGPGIPGIVALGDTANGSPPVYPIGADAEDSDGDDLPDAWETSWAAINDLTQLSDTGDFDADGLTDLEELTAGTNPTNADTDDDGIADGAETNTGTFVNASDTGTNPRDADTDGDGLSDGVETGTGTFVSASDTGTDPLNTDSDNDLINDFDETNSPTRDPNVPEAPQAGDLAEHLTVYYNFDENLQDQAHLIPGTASTAADDLEFIAPHPGTYDPGLFGGGGYFGAGQGGGHAQTAFSPDVDGDIAGPTQEITVQWWGRVDAFTTSWQIGVGRGEGSNWRFHRWGTNPTMAWQGGNNDIHANSAEFNIDDGEWHHFVGTSNGVANVRALWIDGQETVSTTLSGPLNSDPNLPLMIGENPGALNRQWNGGIDDVAIWRRALTGEQIQSLYLAGTNGESLGDLINGPGLDPLGLTVSLASNDPLTIRAEFNTQVARQYDLLVSPDLNSPRESWTELAGFQDIPTDPSGRASVDFPAPYAGTGFIAVREESLPAFFSEDFESGEGDWVAVVNDASNNTVWELGTPSGSTGPLTGADDSANAWSTNLGDYGMDSDISLFSPPLDFSGLPGAELTFEAFRDADGFGDIAVVRFYRVADEVQLGPDHDLDLTVFDTDYTGISVPVPAEVIGENVRIEFNFISDGTADAFSGLTIDNVNVEIVAP